MNYATDNIQRRISKDCTSCQLSIRSSSSSSSSSFYPFFLSTLRVFLSGLFKPRRRENNPQSVGIENERVLALSTSQVDGEGRRPDNA